MRWDPNTEDCNIYSSDDSDSSPFEFFHRATMLSNESDSIDDDLHQKLDLKDPADEDE